VDLPDPGDTNGVDKDDAKAERKKLVQELAEQQELLYADRRHAVLMILQGMDASGKDGTVRHVLSGVNPQGIHVQSFKEPTPLEHAEDFLWRVHEAAPPKGYIGVLNRSHYEDVLVVRVHDLVPERVWRPRFRAINDFERMLTESGVVILKFFLHISKEEQVKRFEKRIEDPRRHWKFSTADLRERDYWDAYQKAYADILHECSTDWAPWHIVPADHKWYRNLVVARHMVKAMKDLDLHYPSMPAE
jgi:PPK2 family polyphosphate:nucleotide phosphotransferase